MNEHLFFPTSLLQPIVQIREGIAIYFVGFCCFGLCSFYMELFFSVQKTLYLKVLLVFLTQELLCIQSAQKESFRRKRLWFQCVTHDRKKCNFAKIVPLGERHTRHKTRTESEGFVFLCRGDTHEVWMNMLTTAVGSKYWLTSAFPEHTASSPVNPALENKLC